MNKKNLLTGILSVALLGNSLTATADNVYTIYPIPQEQHAGTGTGAFTQEVNVIVENGIDEATINRLKDILKANGLTVTLGNQAAENLTNIYLGINGSEDVADKIAAKWGLQREVFVAEGKYDRHSLMLKVENGVANVLVLGENTDAAFFGLASLEQMLEVDKTAMPAVSIYDYADQKSRGIVEGYYGYPYSVSVKKDLMRFMMRYKMNTYLYGAKSDPYHSEKWKEDYPASITEEQKKNGWLSQEMVSDVTQVSHDTKVNFIWAIHPGNDFLYSTTVINDIMGKFDKMYRHGVRQFAVFVDDVSVPSSDADLNTNAQRLTALQKALENKYNQIGALASDTVRPLHFVPQIYCSSFAPSVEVRQKFFRALSSTPSYITIYTTGAGVWSVPNSNDLATVKNDLGRNVGWWWNYPCNDNADGQIYPSDTYSNFYDMPAVNNNATLPNSLENGLGIVSNPMQQGEISKTPLFSVANYAWNTDAFDNKNSWEASFNAILKDENAASAYRYLSQYLRYNDPEVLNSLITAYKSSFTTNKPQPEQLLELFNVISEKCDILIALKNSETESDRLLYNDLAPWLLKLKAMVVATKGLLTSAMEKEITEEVWKNYVASIQTVSSLDKDEQFKAYALEGMGSGVSVSVRPSQPSQKYFLPFINYMKENVLSDIFKGCHQAKTAMFTNANVNGNIYNVGYKCYIRATVTLESGQYIGMELPQPTQLANVTVADTLLWPNFEVVYSGDGKNWNSYNNKEIFLSNHVNYICIKNNSEKPRSLRLVQGNFSITLPEETKINTNLTTIPNGDIWSGHNKSYITDGDYTTFACLNRNQQQNDAYTVKLSSPTVVGDVRICMGTVNGDYMQIGRVETSADGKTWKPLKVKGSTSIDFRMNLPQVIKYSDEMSYCDFNGTNETVQYVRLRLHSANTNKWLRLYEIEVNRQTDADKYRPICVDADNKAITEVVDELPYTATISPVSSLTYHLFRVHPLSKIIIYQDASSSVGATLSICNAGEWKEIGLLKNYSQEVDLSDFNDYSALRISWEGDIAPTIYEIIEVVDENKKPQVATRIEEITSNEGNNIHVVIVDKNVSITSAKGIQNVQICTIEGKNLITYKNKGTNHISLPIPYKSNLLLLNVTLCDGSKNSYKIYMK